MVLAVVPESQEPRKPRQRPLGKLCGLCGHRHPPKTAMHRGDTEPLTPQYVLACGVCARPISEHFDDGFTVCPEIGEDVNPAELVLDALAEIGATYKERTKPSEPHGPRPVVFPGRLSVVQ